MHGGNTHLYHEKICSVRESSSKAEDNEILAGRRQKKKGIPVWAVVSGYRVGSVYLHLTARRRRRQKQVQDSSDLIRGLFDQIGAQARISIQTDFYSHSSI
jgi:hypothetical protein